jgi:hypothetical protein|nr:MAG TPA: hypothetical protein [Caudoviricetes sp.]
MNPERRNARDGANYVRIQQGHSVLLHIALAFLTACFSLIYTIYCALSPNHYFHL